MLNNFPILLSLLEKAVYQLKQSNLIAFKTDTIPGIAGLVNRAGVAKKIYSLKQRSEKKPLVLMYANLIAVLEKFEVSHFGEEILKKYWPGAITFILLEKKTRKKVGIRIPSDDFILELINRVETPLYVTSANLSGKKEILTMKKIEQNFGKKIALYVDQRNEAFNQPSTVVDLTTPTPHVLRLGVINFKESKKRLLI